MSVEGILRRGRRRRAELMRSRCRILRPGSTDPVFDPVTGTYTNPAETVIYDGICQVKPTFSPAEQDGASAERQIVVNAYNLILPWAESNEAAAVDIADIAVVYAGEDTWLLEQRLAVAWVEYADNRTHRRLAVWLQDRGGVTYG